MDTPASPPSPDPLALAESILNATGLDYTPAELNAARIAVEDALKARDARMAGPFFRVKSGAILRAEYAGVVLQFRASKLDGSAHLSVWRLPEHERTLPFDSEDFALDAEGNEVSHGVCVRGCPVPGPRKVVPDGE